MLSKTNVTFFKEASDKKSGLILTFTSEVMELRQRLHDDADEGQVQHGHSGLDLGVSVARVRVVAGQQVVDDAHHLLVEAEHPAGGEDKRQRWSVSVGALAEHTHTHKQRAQ